MKTEELIRELEKYPNCEINAFIFIPTPKKGRVRMAISDEVEKVFKSGAEEITICFNGILND